ncbi:amidohydrolase [Maribacter sp. X9]|uniref:amidohydrolase n=1 Tax=Maribacter sp. X9 TaxID=3402159 RepID=UPI003AF3BA4A
MNQNSHRLKIALIQTMLHWEDPSRNRSMLGSKMEQVSKDTDIIILPEMFTTGFTMNPENIKEQESALTIDWLKQKATNTGCAIVGSTVYKDDGAFYNRLFFVKPNGEYLSYDKRHTFTLAGEHKKYRTGKERLIVDYKGFKFCPLICYDLRFPVYSRNTVDYDVLLFVANWPTPRINAWDTLLKARAIENMAYCIGVNRVGTDNEGHRYPGHSAVYDALGNLLSFSEEEEILEVEIDKKQLTEIKKKFQFLDDRDHFNLLG